MVSIEEHKRSLSEFLNDIEEKVRNDSLVERQKLIGFAASEAACDIFAIFLHKKNLVEPGFNINHRFFASEGIARGRFKFDFQKKALIITLMAKQEECRSLLCYGKTKERKHVEEAIKNLYTLKDVIESQIGDIL